MWEWVYGGWVMVKKGLTNVFLILSSQILVQIVVVTGLIGVHSMHG